MFFCCRSRKFRKIHNTYNVKLKHPQFCDGCGLKEGEMDGVVEIRKVFCYEGQKMSSYLVNIQNFNKNSFSILIS
jgi:hypothetical protein